MQYRIVPPNGFNLLLAWNLTTGVRRATLHASLKGPTLPPVESVFVRVYISISQRAILKCHPAGNRTRTGSLGNFCSFR